jgi:hypothetical protein
MRMDARLLDTLSKDRAILRWDLHLIQPAFSSDDPFLRSSPGKQIPKDHLAYELDILP